MNLVHFLYIWSRLSRLVGIHVFFICNQADVAISSLPSSGGGGVVDNDEIKDHGATYSNSFHGFVLGPNLTIQACVPPKVGSSRIVKMLKLAEGHKQTIWNTYVYSRSSNSSHQLSIAVIRDPLERLWSGYHNICLHQIERENTQSPNFLRARHEPPDFAYWLCANI